MCLNFRFPCSRKAWLPDPGFARSLLWSVPFADAIYDCSSLYQKNYRISGVYKLPPDDFLGSPELEVRPSPPMLCPCPPCPQRDNRASQSNKRETQNRTNTPGEYPNTQLWGGGSPGICFALSNHYQPNTRLDNSRTTT